MSVKRSKSGSRLLAVLEEIARRQPIGVSELARLLHTNKSAVQRTLVTLADEGWIDAAAGTPTRWQLTGHIHVVAHLAHGSSDLRQRARAVLEALRDESGETVGLTVPDIGRFVVIEVLESRHLLRTAPPVGMTVVTRESATGRAVLPYLRRDQQLSLLGGPPNAALAADFEVAVEQGYFVSEDNLVGGSINVAAPIFEASGQPVAAVILSAPRERLPRDRYASVGAMVVAAARRLSRGAPSQEARRPHEPRAVSKQTAARAV